MISCGKMYFIKTITQEQAQKHNRETLKNIIIIILL